MGTGLGFMARFISGDKYTCPKERHNAYMREEDIQEEASHTPQFCNGCENGGTPKCPHSESNQYSSVKKRTI